MGKCLSTHDQIAPASSNKARLNPEKQKMMKEPFELFIPNEVKNHKQISLAIESLRKGLKMLE